MNLAYLSAAVADIPLIPLVAAERIRPRALRGLGVGLGWVWLLGPGLALWLVLEWAVAVLEVARPPSRGPAPDREDGGPRAY